MFLTDTFVRPVEVDVLGVQPHAHDLATEVRAFADAAGRLIQRPLILIKDWDFHCQDSYRGNRPAPIRLPTRTTLTLRYSYDNSHHPPAQPDPPT